VALTAQDFIEIDAGLTAQNDMTSCANSHAEIAIERLLLGAVARDIRMIAAQTGVRHTGAPRHHLGIDLEQYFRPRESRQDDTGRYRMNSAEVFADDRV